MLRRVDQALGVGCGEAVLETGEHSLELFPAELQLLLEKLLGYDAGEREVLHDGYSFFSDLVPADLVGGQVQLEAGAVPTEDGGGLGLMLTTQNLPFFT